MKLLVHSTRALLSYDCLVDRDKYEMEKLQNCAMRVIQHRDRYASVHEMHSDLDIEWLDERRKVHTSQQVYKGVYKLGPPRFNDLFVQVSEVSERVTRASTQNDLVVPPYLLECSRNNISYRGAVDWNFVPYVARKQDTLNKYKSALHSIKPFVHDLM